MAYDKLYLKISSWNRARRSGTTYSDCIEECRAYKKARSRVRRKEEKETIAEEISLLAEEGEYEPHLQEVDTVKELEKFINDEYATGVRYGCECGCGGEGLRIAVDAMKAYHERQGTFSVFECIKEETINLRSGLPSKFIRTLEAEKMWSEHAKGIH